MKGYFILASVAISCATGLVAGAPRYVEEDCLMCIQSVPECIPACQNMTEVCYVTPQTCHACPRAYCVPRNTTSNDSPHGNAAVRDFVDRAYTLPARKSNVLKLSIFNPKASDVDCVKCPAIQPKCDCIAGEQCVRVPRTCQTCAKAVCLPQLPLRSRVDFQKPVKGIDVPDLMLKMKANRLKKERLEKSLQNCIPCPREVPVCPTCPDGFACMVTEQSCTMCQKAECIPDDVQRQALISAAKLDQSLPKDGDDCVKCLWQPSCETVQCPENTKCVLIKGDCQHCDQVTCVKANDDTPMEDLNSLKDNDVCVQCLWNPTCETANCPAGTECHYSPQTCHACAQAVCLPKYSA